MMKEESGAGWVVVVIVVVAMITYCFAMAAYGKATGMTCQALGWQGGNSKGWFTGYCYEYGNEDRWQYHSCDLEYVLAGACEPMWPDAE